MTTLNDLRGLSVLITRPEGQGDKLALAIESRGGRALLVPLLEIAPLDDPLSLQRIKNLQHYQLALFISSNAAREGVRHIKEYWAQLPQALSLLAIGPGTAKELEALHSRVTVADSGTRSEDLLRRPELQNLQGTSIALFRGRGGRELLADTLRARGASVDYIELYERHTPGITTEQLSALMSANTINVITVTSSQILENLLKLVASNKAFRGLIPLLVASQRISNEAHAAGFVNVINVAGADDLSMLNGLAVVAQELNTRSDTNMTRKQEV